MKSTSIGIIAPSAKVPQVELKLGLERLRQEGFQVKVHPQCRESDLFFAGTDLSRAKAIWDFACDRQTSILWAARGGHGAIRILPFLKSWTQKKGVPPKKLWIGYSDSTALMEFVRSEWGWATLHGPMPSLRKFSLLEGRDWQALVSWMRKEETPTPWQNNKLHFWTKRPKNPIEAIVVGGNLTVWNCLLGTPFQASCKNSMLFLEDVDESLYRIDRMMQQLLLSGSLSQTKAILLGNFMNCKDHSPSVLKKMPKPNQLGKLLITPGAKDLKPLRKTFSQCTALQRIFTEIGNQLNIPVAFGLPVGHGPEVSAMPMGAKYRLLTDGRFELLSWDWFKY